MENLGRPLIMYHGCRKDRDARVGIGKGTSVLVSVGRMGVPEKTWTLDTREGRFTIATRSSTAQSIHVVEVKFK